MKLQNLASARFCVSGVRKFRQNSNLLQPTVFFEMTRFQRFLTALSCAFFCVTVRAETVVSAQDGIVLNLVSRLDDFGAYATSVQLPRPINFGIVAYTRPSPNEAVVNATIHSLRRSFGEENVRVREYTMTGARASHS